MQFHVGGLACSHVRRFISNRADDLIPLFAHLIERRNFYGHFKTAFGVYFMDNNPLDESQCGEIGRKCRIHWPPLAWMCNKESS